MTHRMEFTLRKTEKKTRQPKETFFWWRYTRGWTWWLNFDGVATALCDGTEELETEADGDALGELLGVEDVPGEGLDVSDIDRDRNGRRAGGKISSRGTPSRSAWRQNLAIFLVALLIMSKCCGSSKLNICIFGNCACDKTGSNKANSTASLVIFMMLMR